MPLVKEYQRPVLVRNLTVLMLVAFPLGLLVAALQRVSQGEASVPQLVLGTLGAYAIAAFPILVGGLIHQLLTLNLPAAWGRGRRLVVTVVLSPVVLAGLAVFVHWYALLSLWLPIAFGGLAYCGLIRFSSTAEDGRLEPISDGSPRV